MTAQDRLGCVLLVILCVGAPTLGLLYVRNHRSTAINPRIELTGTVVMKRVELPSGKQMYPVRFALVVEEGPRHERKLIWVDHGTYVKAAVGMKVMRDRRGHVSLMP